MANLMFEQIDITELDRNFDFNFDTENTRDFGDHTNPFDHLIGRESPVDLQSDRLDLSPVQSYEGEISFNQLFSGEVERTEQRERSASFTIPENPEIQVPVKISVQDSAQKIALTVNVNVLTKPATSVVRGDLNFGSDESDGEPEETDIITQSIVTEKKRKRTPVVRRRYKRRKVHEKEEEERYDKNGIDQTKGNYLKDAYGDLYWFPPWKSSFDGRWYCHDAECKRSFCSKRTLQNHIWCQGHAWRENHNKFENGKQGHNAEFDESERHLMFRCGREFIPESFDPYDHCPECEFRSVSRTNMLRHVKKDHIDVPPNYTKAEAKQYKDKIARAMIVKRKRGIQKKEKIYESEEEKSEEPEETYGKMVRL